MSQRCVAALLTALLVALVAVFSAAHPVPARRLAIVVRVVDGDTLVVRLDGREETVRLVGVDTPETVRPTIGIEPGGPGTIATRKRSSRGGSVILTAEQWASTGDSPVLLRARPEGTSTERRHGSIR